MTEPHRPRVKYVIGPDGSPLTIADLPAPGTKRWVIRRKAEVVAAVRGGLLSLEEACSRYTLTVEEFLSWQYSIDQHGLAGPAHDPHPAISPVTRRLIRSYRSRQRRRHGPAFSFSDASGMPQRVCRGSIASRRPDRAPATRRILCARMQLRINPALTINRANLAGRRERVAAMGDRLRCKVCLSLSRRSARRALPRWAPSPSRWSAFSPS